MSGAQPQDPHGPRPGGPLPQRFREDYELARTDDDRRRVIARDFDLQPVGSDQDVRPEMLYCLCGRQHQVIRLSAQQSQAELLAITALPSGQRMQPVARRKLLELGIKGQLLRLVPKAAGSDRDTLPAGPQEPIQTSGSHIDCLVELGTFSQLLTAVRQSEILPDADQIAYVRDREFRMGHYHRAFDVIERLYVKFGQAASQRQQQLRAEELKYKAGVLKMSPKQWMLKKQRDTLQTQKIERARRQFARILDGLRILVVSK